MRKNKQNLKLVLKYLISAALLYFVFRYVGFGKILDEIANISIFYLIFSIFMTLVFIVLASSRLKNIVTAFNYKLSLKSSMHYTLISSAFGLVTPGRFGELIKIRYLAADTGSGYLKLLVIFVIDKIFDFIAMILLALFGFLFFEAYGLRKISVIALVFYVLVLIVAYIYSDNFAKLVRYFMPGKYKNKLKNINLTRKLYLNLALVSLLIWAIHGVQAFFVMKALHISPPIYFVLGLVPLMALASIIPVSIGGIGVRELIAIYFSLMIGITAEKAALFSLIYAIIGMGFPALLGAILYVGNRKNN